MTEEFNKDMLADESRISSNKWKNEIIKEIRKLNNKKSILVLVAEPINNNDDLKTKMWAHGNSYDIVEAVEHFRRSTINSLMRDIIESAKSKEENIN